MATINGTPFDDYLVGYAGNDRLYGLDGDDTLDGGSGADYMNGGYGSDWYIVDNAADVANEEGGLLGGHDTVLSSVTYGLYGLSFGLEDLTLTGTAAINGTGNDLANVILGNTANNVLNGGAGNDTLHGMGGNDALYGGANNDVLYCGAGNDTLDGGTGNDALYSGAGNDTLNGGPGYDVMSGGAGNDKYYVDTMAEFFPDQVIESAGSGSGIDTVYSTVHYSLPDNVENLNLIGAAAIHGLGNSQDNVIQGNSAGNWLSGGGGADRYLGGAGNDLLSFDPADLVPSGARYQGGVGGEIAGSCLAGDTVWMNGHMLTLDLVTLPNDRITGVEIFDLASGFGNNTLILNPAEVIAVSDTDEVWVKGGFGDVLSSPNSGWVPAANVICGGEVYEHYTFGAADLFVDANIGGVVS